MLKYKKNTKIKLIIYIIFISFCCLYAYKEYETKKITLQSKKNINQTTNLTQDDIILISNNKFNSLLSEKNKPKLVLIYTAWCRYCREEIAMLSNILPNYQNKNFNIILISLDNDKKNLLNLLNQYNIGNLAKIYLADTNLKETIYFLLGNYKIKYSGTIPILAIFDKDGNVYQSQRYKKPDALNKLIQLILN